MVRRVYVEKKQGFDMEARRLKEELSGFLGEKYPELARLRGLRVLKRYDASNLDEGQFGQLTETVFSEPQCDRVHFGPEPLLCENERCFGIEYLPGQYDQRADSAEQCAELVTGVKPKIKTASFYIFEGEAEPLSDAALDGIKKYLINPVDSREASMEVPLSLEEDGANPPDVPVLAGFARDADLEKLAGQYGLGMSIEDLLFCRNWFSGEGRDPTLAELRVLDTYWSDHCRHTTFNTFLEEIKITGMDDAIRNALELYEEARREVYGDEAKTRPRSLMDMATIGAKALKKRGLIPDVDESSEINACTVKVTAEFPDGPEPWLLLFKNETHNHPTEIEPFGGAATCLGGAIRDPLSGRAFVHQAMRVTGGGDPRAGLDETLPGKLPQIKIAREAAAGYASYGNQIGLATGQVAEFYHPGFLAKRMELGAVIGAVPEACVRREEPIPGDLVILVGGRTGRDGIGGATGSSRAHSGESVESSGAEVQKGNAVEERKLQRLFRKAEVSRLIKRCNDFGAGGVSVAVGELAAGLDIDLDAAPKKYAGLDGTELAISESQERMAVVVSAADTDAFIKAATEENLEAVVIAKVTAGLGDDAKARLRMTWRGKTIVDLSREFLNSNGAPRHAKALMRVPDVTISRRGLPEKDLTRRHRGTEDYQKKTSHGGTEARNSINNLEFSRFSPIPLCPCEMNFLEKELESLQSGSRRGLQECFDGSVGAASVLFPWGGGEQGTPECGMAALLPSLGKQSRTASLMTFGYDPVLMGIDPYRGAKGAVREALAKFACLGGNLFTARLSLQEYFGKPLTPETWGQPAAALLGALEAQLRLGVPAIGGKDSMSGNYNAGDINLTVPPTLVAFAAGTAPAASVRSGALSGKRGNAVILLAQPPENLGLGNTNVDIGDTNACVGYEWDAFRANMKTLHALAASGALKAAYPVGPGGVAATLAVMAFGNMTGVEAYEEAFSRMANHINYQGSVLAEIDEAALPAGLDASWVLVARTLSEPVFRILPKADASNTTQKRCQAPLVAFRQAYESPLAKVYPQTSTGSTVAVPVETANLTVPAFNLGRASFDIQKHTHLSTQSVPLAVLPVFPGTNCEWDMERAFQEAGARTRLVIFRNRSGGDIAESLRELIAAFGEAQIIAFSGGFSAGDEPDGSGKFIANVIRCGPVAAAITEFLEKRDGLILGICNGFQALIKTGLVPYGRIIAPANSMPTLTYNAIGRHVSRMVRTRVMPNVSPWLSLEKPGAIHLVPVSHGEGRLVVTPDEAEALFGAGQVPFCYVDSDGNPTMAEPDNPNGAAFAIEALTSPDGRVLGKMAHSERCGEFVHVNIPGDKRQKIFEAGVRYFK